MKTETLSSVWILLEDYAESRGSGLHMAANQLDRPQAGRTESYGSVEVAPSRIQLQAGIPRLFERRFGLVLYVVFNLY